MLLSRLLGRTTDTLVEGISTPKNYRDRFFFCLAALLKERCQRVPCTRVVSASGGYLVATNAYTFAIDHPLRRCHPGADGQPRRLRGPVKWQGLAAQGHTPINLLLTRIYPCIISHLWFVMNRAPKRNIYHRHVHADPHIRQQANRVSCIP